VAELKQFKLPDVGEGLTEADIVTWRVKPGDRVTVNQVIVEIETAKSLVELPSPYEGVVTSLLVPEGESVDVGIPIIEVDVAPGATGGPGAGGGQVTTGEPGAGGGQVTAGEPGAGREQVTAGAAPEQAASTEQAAAPDQAPAPGQGAAPGQGVAAGQGVPAGQGGAAEAPERTAAAAAVNQAFKPERGRAAAAGSEAATGQLASEPGIEGSPAPKIERQAVLVGYGVRLGTTTRRPRKGRPGTAAPAAPAAPGADGGTAAVGNGHAEAAPGTEAAPGPAAAGPATRPAAKPPVRKLAKDLGVDLAGLAGTGPGGTITRDDVQAAAGQPVGAGPTAAGPAAAPAAPRLAGAPKVPLGGEERIPIRGVQKAMAAAMAASAFTAPHVTEFLQVDVTETMRATERLREMPDFEGLRPSPLLLAAKALLVAVARHPMINSSWDEDSQEIVVKHYVNLGIAAATDRGLIVPNIKDAHNLPLPELARALANLAATARAGKSQPADQAGGTITITNVGVFGVDTGTPILTPGQAAILAFGQVKDAPWVHEGALAVRSVTTLALSFDHRIVDGALGSAVLRDVGAMLTDPVRMIAWG
jgi:pyruvate dehydrogenase E2 component (dihydrolipoamide acetyltransferase)